MIMNARSSCIWKYWRWSDVADGTNRKDADANGAYRELDREKYFSTRGKRRKAIVDIIVKWASTSDGCETRCPPLPVISAWYLDGRDVEEMEYTFGDFCACHEINQYARVLPKIRKNNFNIWYHFQTLAGLWSSDLCEGPPSSLGLEAEREETEGGKESSFQKGRYIDHRIVHSTWRT